MTMEEKIAAMHATTSRTSDELAALQQEQGVSHAGVHASSAVALRHTIVACTEVLVAAIERASFQK